MSSKEVYKTILLPVIFFVGIFCVFAFLFLRRSSEVEVRIILTEREWAKTWDNFPDGFYLDNLSVGMAHKDEIGRATAVVKDIYYLKLPYLHKRALLTLKIKANYNSKTQTYSYQGQPLNIGSYQRVTLGGTLIQGYVLAVDKNIQPYRERQYMVKGKVEDVFESAFGGVNTRILGTLKENLAVVQKGEKILDSRGEVAAEVVSIERFTVERSIFSDSGRKVLSDQDFETAEVELMVKTLEINGQDYWDFATPLRVGTRMELSFPNFNLPLRITEIVSVEEIK